MEVGQTVFADFGKYSTANVRKGVVERITPSGQIVIKFGDNSYKFRDGRQITSDAWHKARIVDAEEASDLLKEQNDRLLRRKIKSALNDISISGEKSEILASLWSVVKLAEQLPDD